MGEVVYMRMVDAAEALVVHGEECEACDPIHMQVGCEEGQRLWEQYIAGMNRVKRKREAVDGDQGTTS